MQSQKRQNDLCLFPRQTIQYHGNTSLCPYQQCWRSWSWTVLWRPIRPFRTNTQKRCPFHYRGLECKSRKSRNTWSNRQIWPWSTEWSSVKANRVLPRECTSHSKHLLLTNTREDSTHGHHHMANTKIRLTILCSQRSRSSIQSTKTRPGADCGSDHELFTALGSAAGKRFFNTGDI